MLIEGAVHLFDGKLTELKNAIITEFPALKQHSRCYSAFAINTVDGCSSTVIGFDPLPNTTA